MADQAQGNILSTATNPSSVGAVFFDKPTYDLQSIQLKLKEDAETWQLNKEKQLADAQVKIEDLTKDIPTDIKGDVGLLPIVNKSLFSQRENAMKYALEAQQAAKMFGTGSQQYFQANENLEKAKNDMFRTINDGKEASKRIKALTETQLDASKVDIDVIPKITEDFMQTPYLDKDGNVSPIWQDKFTRLSMLPKTKSVDEDINELIKTKKDAGVLTPISGEPITKRDAKSGEILLTQTEQIIDNDRATALATEHLLDPKKQDRIKGLFKKMSEDVDEDGSPRDASYVMAVKNAADPITNPDGLSPEQIWLRDRYLQNNAIKKATTSLGTPFAEQEAIKSKYGKEQSENEAFALLRSADQYIMGSPETLTQGRDFFGNIVVKPQGLNTVKIGKTLNSSGETIDNVIEDSYRAANGVVYVLTTKGLNVGLERAKQRYKKDGKTLEEGQTPPKEYFRMTELYEPVSTTAKLYSMIINGIDDPIKKQQVMEAADRAASKRNAGTGGAYKTGAFYERKQGDTEKINEIYERGLVTTPIGTEEQKETYFGTPQTKTVNTATDGMTQEQWNAKWASLKSGETLVGLDGQTYKKK